MSYLNNGRGIQTFQKVRKISGGDGVGGGSSGDGGKDWSSGACKITDRVWKGYYTTRSEAFIVVILLILGGMMLVGVGEVSGFVLGKHKMENRRDIKIYPYGGRLGTYDLFIRNITADNSSSQTKIRKKQMAAQYKSTWCTVPYQRNTSIEYRKEMCVVDTLSNVFYVLWDGYNVLQWEVEPSLERIAAFNTSIPGNLPEAYSGQLFVIANNKFAMNCVKQNISSALYSFLSTNSHQYLGPNNTMYFLTATEAADFVLKNPFYYFRVFNHPSGSGVYIKSEVFGLCIRTYGVYNPIDKLFEIAFAECDTRNEHQKFFWTGTSLISASASKKGTSTPFTLRFFSMMYGYSIGFVSFNTREASSLTLLLVTDENKNRNPFITRSDVLTSSSKIEGYYSSRTLLEINSTLQDQLLSAAIPFAYSSARQLSNSVFILIGLLSLLVQIL